MSEINLDNPIFVYYINVSNMPFSRVQQLLDDTNNNFCKISNITFWIVPITDNSNFANKIECIYQGRNHNPELMDFISKIGDVINSNEIDSIKSKIRDLILKYLL